MLQLHFARRLPCRVFRCAFTAQPDGNKAVRSLQEFRTLLNSDISKLSMKDFSDAMFSFGKEKYKLIIQNKDSKITKKIIKNDIEKFFDDTTKLTRKIVRMKYELAPNYNLKIYNFKIIRMLRVEGYDYTQILKIVLINFVASIFFIFIFHIRKFITLF